MLTPVRSTRSGLFPDTGYLLLSMGSGFIESRTFTRYGAAHCGAQCAARIHLFLLFTSQPHRVLYDFNMYFADEADNISASHHMWTDICISPRGYAAGRRNSELLIMSRVAGRLGTCSTQDGTVAHHTART